MYELKNLATHKPVDVHGQRRDTFGVIQDGIPIISPNCRNSLPASYRSFQKAERNREKSNRVSFPTFSSDAN